MSDKILPIGSIYSVFNYLCDNEITTVEKAISGEKLAKFIGEKDAARQKALSFESIEDDLRGLLLHLRLIEKVPGSETGKDVRYYVPEAVKKKQGEIFPILEQFRGKDLRPKVLLLDQIYEEKIKPILEASANSEPITNEQQFSLRIQDIRERYYSKLNSLRYQNANDVIELGAAFREEVISAIKDLFDFLKVRDGIVLITDGSFARNQHVEGSDFDWYFVLDGSQSSIILAKSIQKIFSEARIQLDEDIIPRFNQRDGPKLQDDWEVSLSEKTHWLTIDEVTEFYNRDPFAIIGKIVGTLDTMYIAGDRTLYARVREAYETNNAAMIGQIRERIVQEIEYTATREFNPQQFDIKSDRGMILGINDIFWLLQLNAKELRLDWEFKNPIDMLDYYAAKGYLSAEDKDSLTRILCFYLLLRNSIVLASASYYAHPTGYETKYFKEISADIATRMGFDSTAQLEKLVFEYSNKVIEIQKRILANCDGENRDSVGVVPKGTPATLLRYMYANKIFADNPQKSSEMALQRGGNDSLRTIQRELQVLREAGLIEGSGQTGYYLPEWLGNVEAEEIIGENPELNKPSPSTEEIQAIRSKVLSTLMTPSQEIGISKKESSVFSTSSISKDSRFERYERIATAIRSGYHRQYGNVYVWLGSSSGFLEKYSSEIGLTDEQSRVLQAICNDMIKLRDSNDNLYEEVKRSNFETIPDATIEKWEMEFSEQYNSIYGISARMAKFFEENNTLVDNSDRRWAMHFKDLALMYFDSFANHYVQQKYESLSIVDISTLECFQERSNKGYFKSGIPSELFVTGDGFLLNVLFNNIIMNAFSYSYDVRGAEGVRIDIKFEKTKDTVNVIISDNGSGIPSDKLAEIFNLAYSTSGGGVGLAVAYYIVKDLGGTIDVQSELGKGTTFTIRLPVAQDTQPPRGAISLPQGNPNLKNPSSAIDKVVDVSQAKKSDSQALSGVGGVDFRALPIVNQPMNTPRVNVSLSRLDNFKTDPEWNEIQNMVNAGIIPSGQRIKDYLQSCCQKKEFNREIGRVLSCIADIMRIEEERVLATDQDLKSLLVLVESGKSENELVSALSRINFSPKEPESVIP